MTHRGTSPTVREGSLFLLDSEPSLTVGLMPRNMRLDPNSPQHYSTNQAAERPDKEPVGAKLSPAAAVAAGDARLSGQGGLIVNAFDMEVPDRARQTGGRRCVKICAVEGREITRRTPEISADAQDNFFSWLLRKYAESGIDQCL